MLRRLVPFSCRPYISSASSLLGNRAGSGANCAPYNSFFVASRFHGSESKDYYKALGVSKTATAQEIKKAYRKRALETHPDQGGNKEEFAEVAEAYECLSNAEKRKIYDQYGSEAANQAGMGGFGAGGRSAEDIFAEFFKGGMGGFGDMFGRGMGMNRGPPQVQPLEARLRLTLEEVYSGVSKKLRVTRPTLCSDCTGFGTKSKTEKPKCFQCDGTGHLVQQHRMGPGMIQQTVGQCPRCHGTGTTASPQDECPRCHGKGYRKLAQDVQIEIPSGVPSNVTLVVRGEGGTIPGAQPGDLHVHVEVSKHKVFNRRGDDLIVEKEIPLSGALLGHVFPLTLLDGRKINVKVPTDTIVKPDGVIKVQGEGMPRSDGHRGDIYIFTTVKMPVKLTEEQKEHLRKAFGVEEKEDKTPPENPIIGRVLRVSREELEEEKRSQWSAQEGRGGGGFRGSSGSRGGDESQAECVHQ